jgi:tRNA-(ms[2]io[6]A)-hydroxylase
MKVSIDVKVPSSEAWLDAVMNDFDSFLQDHADCERKASAMAMSLVAKLHDKQEIIPELIATAIEELEHFRDVYAIMQERNIDLSRNIQEDVYVKQLLQKCDGHPDKIALDRLLLGSVVECRGAERFRRIWERLEPGELKKFYHRLWASEAKHGNVFAEMALKYYSKEQVYKRLDQLMDAEADIISKLPIKAALH